MDTKELERFCPWARQELVDAVMRGMVQLGVDEAGRGQWPAGSEAVAGRALSPGERTRRDCLMAEAAAAGDAAFAEREAYSWFNRLMALRYMELHGLLPWGGRALSAADGSFAPELATRAADLPLANLDRAAYLERAAKSDDEGAFRLALEAACAELAGALPGVFEGASCDLLPKGLLARGEHNVIQHLVEDVPEASWEDVEALGWAYQFYNSERKDDFFKSKRKAAAEDIAPATQLFTPDWIVRYMVQNSLGRLWMLNNPESPLRDKMEFYIEPGAEHEDFLRVSGPEEITFLDPACGSGHILVYAFQLLTEMYRERGWRDRDIARSILESNLSGYEIDPRAAQIAQTALCMEALSLDRRWLTRGVTADVRVLGNIELDEEQLPETYVKRELADAIRHLGEVGSLLDPGEADLAALDAAIADAGAADLLGSALRGQLLEARGQLEALSRRFDVVVANPPYMGSSSFNPFVAKWIKKRYPDSCRDLCTAFIERGYKLAKERGYAAMVTMQSWMFLGSFEKMRERMIERAGIVSMAHIGPRAFDAIGGEVVNVTAAVLHNAPLAGEGSYIRLVDVAGSEPKRAALLEAIQNPDCGRFHRADASTFHDIPGSPIAYWASEAMHEAFRKGAPFKEIAHPRVGMQTGKNDRFLRLWWEIPAADFSKQSASEDEFKKTGCKWAPYNKGGSFRKWYGNLDYVVLWKNEGEAIKALDEGESRCFSILPVNKRFVKSITWTDITSSGTHFRLRPIGSLYDIKGMSCFPDSTMENAILSFSNSSVAAKMLGILAPTMNNQVGDIGKLPILEIQSDDLSRINSMVANLVKLSQADWDSQETSWDFKRNPLI
ncbi:MAG: BREX-1 system adenine-specific DNA-methyltransferase PglX [Collinsella intestinalis]|nr:BREX-1 system adenine-specific DNA-methyltransferase PglX [Collinsella intestinalis]